MIRDLGARLNPNGIRRIVYPGDPRMGCPWGTTPITCSICQELGCLFNLRSSLYIHITLCFPVEIYSAQQNTHTKHPTLVTTSSTRSITAEHQSPVLPTSLSGNPDSVNPYTEMADEVSTSYRPLVKYQC